MITFTGVSFFKDHYTTCDYRISCFNPDKIKREASVLVAVSTMTSLGFHKIRNKTFSVLLESRPALESQ
jgi:hypothetical protein